MGGGALMTPILVLLFKVQPLAAVSSDLVAAVVMKPIGGAVHLRRGTVNKRLVGWLMAGSIPSAFGGVLLLRAMGDGQSVQNHIKTFMGWALLLAVATMIVRALLNVRRRAVKGLGILDDPAGVADHAPEVHIRPIPTLLVGLAGGLLVGMTSVGSGSIIIVALLMLYPQLKASELVGTDLIQAVPLVAAAALGHIIFGEFKLDLTTSLLIGSVPGVYIGARVSAIAPGRVIRRALAFVLSASALKLLNLGNAEVAVLLGAAAVLGPLAWRFVRATGGLRRGFAALSAEGYTAPVAQISSPAPAESGPSADEPAEMAAQGR
ncbi:MAG TPA: sulfite exporter TauE/SafE family protein [Acidimicrobiia bacterium]|nr:sulfite exporter TauE/SafE family protein [Acidimicrobiia bacterium]